MAQAEVHETLSVGAQKLFDTVIRYEDYPKFVDGVKSVKVERLGPGKARVTYHVSVMKEVSYTLEHTEDAKAGTIGWTLVESDFFKKNEGKWLIKAEGDGESKCHVDYDLDVEFKFPVPGFILKSLIKGPLPSMIRAFEKRAQGV